MTSSRALARAGLIVSGAFLVSRVLGWIRVVVIVNAFGGAGSIDRLDEFYAAFRLPDLVFQLVAAGALSSAVIPILAALLATGETARTWRVASTIANLMLLGLLVTGVIVFVAAPVIIPAVIAPGWDATPERWTRTVDLTRIMILSPIFLALGSLATSVLNAQGRFVASAIAPIIYNLAIIGAALLLAPAYGVTALAIGVVAGSIGHLLVQVWPLRALGYRYDRDVDVADPEARKALTLMAPRALGLGAGQITFVVVTSLASGLQNGAVTAFNTAFTLLQIPIGVIGVPLGVVVLPSLSREVAAGRIHEFAALMSRAIRLIVFVMLPITAVAIVVRHDVVQLLFSRLDPSAVDLTAATLLTFLVGLTAHALIAVLARAFYARQDTRTPVAAAILAVIVNSSLAAILVGPMGLPGLGLAIAIAAWLETIVLVALLRRTLPELEIGPIVDLAIRSAGVAVAGGLVAAGVSSALGLVMGADPSRIGILVRLTIVGTVWLLTSAAVAAVLRIGELAAIIALMLDLVRRPRGA
ncbi:MAG TPA: murein biosynthesis integral membrane protein MurJ [Candidatus Limnocylindrales bacterium]|nr:murein biosynthesis integral membrane protein MurJ [Candidatus Limnocylindrales bacterium]